jgi:hypothetical protein
MTVERASLRCPKNLSGFAALLWPRGTLNRVERMLNQPILVDAAG